MTKKEYAEAIATQINGNVKEVEKANGIIYTGIEPGGDASVRPCVYIDKMFENGMSVEDATEEVKKMLRCAIVNAPNIDPDNYTNYAKAKSSLRVRLYNSKTNTEVYRSASEYGFDDLILVPALELGNGMSIRMTKALIENYNVTEDEVFNTAIENTKADGYDLKSMFDMLRELMGQLPEDITSENNPMYVLTNKTKFFGAVAAVVFADELKEKFPEGYIVIPSSVHEVIILPKEYSEGYLNSMVGEVNDQCLSPDEVLGNKVYIFD